MTPYADLVPHADDFTLMAPYGGETRRGLDDPPEALAQMARFFRQWRPSSRSALVHPISQEQLSALAEGQTV